MCFGSACSCWSILATLQVVFFGGRLYTESSCCCQAGKTLALDSGMSAPVTCMQKAPARRARAEKPLDTRNPASLLCLPDFCSSCAAGGQADGSAKQGLAGLPGPPNLHRDSIRAGYPEAPQAESSWNDWNDSEGEQPESVSVLLCVLGGAGRC